MGVSLPPVPDAPKSLEILALEKRDADLAIEVARVDGAAIARDAAIDARVKALEAKPAPTANTIVPSPQSVADALNGLAPGSFAILRAPATDILVQKP